MTNEVVIHVSAQDDTEAVRAKIVADWKAIPPVTLGVQMTGGEDFLADSRALVNAASDQQVHVDADLRPDPAKMRAELDAAIKEVGLGDGLKVPVTIDPRTVTSSAQQAGREGGSLLASALGLGLIAGGPMIGAAFAGVGVVGATALAAAMVKGNAEVKAGWTSLVADAKATGTQASTSMVDPITGGLKEITNDVVGFRPEIDAMFSGAAQGVQPLVQGISGLASNALPGLDAAMEHSRPIAQGLADDERALGRVIGDIGQQTAQSSNEINSDLSQLATTVSTAGKGIADLEGITAKLAQGALPVINGELSTLVGTLGAVDSALGPFGPALGATVTTALIAAPAYKKLESAADGLASKLSGSKMLSGANDLIQSTTGIAGGLGGLAKGLPVVGTAVIGLSAAEGVLVAMQNKGADSAAAQASGNSALNAVLGQTKQLTLDQINAGVIADAQSNLHIAATKSLASGSATLNETLQQTGVTQQQFAAAVENGGTAMDFVRGKFADYIGSTDKASAAGKNVSDVQIGAAQNADYLGRQLGVLRGQFVASAGAAQLHAAQLAKASGNAQGAASNTMQLASDMLVLNDRTSSADQRIQALQDDLATLADHGFERAEDQLASFESNLSAYVTEMATAKGATVDQSGALDLMTERGRDTLATLESSRSSMVGWAQSMADAGAPLSQIKAGLQDQADQLVNVMVKMGLSKTTAEALLAQYQLLPKDITTNIKANTVQASGAVRSLQQQIDAMHGKTVALHAVADTTQANSALETLIGRYNGRTVIIRANVQQGTISALGTSGLSRGAGGPLPAAAAGTALTAPWTLVGEYGPELIKGPAGGTVYPASNTRSMLSGGGDVNVNITMDVAPGGENSLAGLIRYMVRTGTLRFRTADGRQILAN